MANNVTYRGNLFNPSLKPLIMPGLFAAGATKTVNAGDIIELFTGSDWIPIVSDAAMNSNIAVASVEIKDGHKAGYYPIIVPRPGDYFEYTVNSASHKLGDSLYWVTGGVASQTLTAVTGSNIIARIASDWQYPYPQYAGGDGVVGDQGVTVRTVTKANIIFLPGVSYYSLIEDLAV